MDEKMWVTLVISVDIVHKFVNNFNLRGFAVHKAVDDLNNCGIQVEICTKRRIKND